MTNSFPLVLLKILHCSLSFVSSSFPSCFVFVFLTLCSISELKIHLKKKHYPGIFLFVYNSRGRVLHISSYFIYSLSFCRGVFLYSFVLFGFVYFNAISLFYSSTYIFRFNFDLSFKLFYIFTILNKFSV